ncbi:MAG: hypothetical protein M1820_007551 [Bogoriella megaspora]|nr:MAG: hypothetical protein M1820_007551 [Bogoriella megaspora]
MVGHTNDETYSVLERSFHGNPSMKTNNTLSRRRASFGPTRSSEQSDPSTPSRFYTPQPDRHSSPPAKPLALHPAPSHLAAGLPPTPPSHTQGDQQETQHDSSSGLSTPINQQSPPTPETTPPRNRGNLTVSRPSLKSRTPSSFAGSFKTAREEQSMEDDGSYHNVPSEVSSHSYSGAWSQSGGRRPASLVPEIGLGLNFEYMVGEGTSVESTPGERHPQPPNQDTQSAESNADRNEDRMQNITIRQRKPRSVSPRSTEETRKPSSSISKTYSSNRPEQASLGGRLSKSPDITKFAREIGWPSAVHDPAQTHSFQDSRKRLSTVSTTSAVVEAMVVATPMVNKQRRRSLRRMGKNESLRNEDDLNSDDIPTHRLLHKRSPISEQANRDSSGPIVSSRVVSTPDRPRPDSAPVIKPTQSRSYADVEIFRPIPSPSYNTGLKQLPPGLDRVGLGYFDIARNPKPSANNAPRKNEGRLRDSAPSSRSETEHARKDIHSQGRRSLDPTTLRLASRPFSPYTSRQALPSPPKEVRPSFERNISSNSEQHNSLDRDIPSEEPVLPIMGTRVESSASPEDRKYPSSLENSPNVQPRPRLHHESPALPHNSIDFLRAPNSDHMLARQIRSSTSPHSEVSSFQGPVEVSEATAVSIYPHNNNSLLVVQQLAHPSTSNAIERRQTVSSLHSVPSVSHTRSQSQPTPTFTAAVLPATPPTSSSPARTYVEEATFLKPILPELTPPRLSPLKNPRDAPQPPAFKIIPPTPLSEIESPFSPIKGNIPKGQNSTKHGFHSPSSKANRRRSFAQRARRISEPLIQPFLQAKAQFPRPSNKDRFHLHAHPPSVPSVTDQPEESNRLHPFWRPRGFWDDFSDSESDDFYDDRPGTLVAGRHIHTSHFETYDPEFDRLPEGGDTRSIPSSLPSPGTDTASPTQIGGALTRRFGSFRNSFASKGGFLIGNSLGINRQPSNSRRHIVRLPAPLRAKLVSGSKIHKRSSLDSGSLKSANLRLAHQQNGLAPRASLTIRNARAGLEGHKILNRSGGSGGGNMGFRAGLDGVKERIVAVRQERKREELKKSIGKMELVHDGRTPEHGA